VLCYVYSLYTEDNLGQHNTCLDTVNAKDRPIELVNLTWTLKIWRLRYVMLTHQH